MDGQIEPSPDSVEGGKKKVRISFHLLGGDVQKIPNKVHHRTSVSTSSRFSGGRM